MDDDLPEGFKYATTEELAEALGSTPEEAKQIAIRLERLAGNFPSLLTDGSNDKSD